MSAAVLWPVVLGTGLLVVGIICNRRELAAATARDLYGLTVLGPTFVAASLAAFAGEHFTAASTLARIVPSWLPGRLFIAYFVGAAHLAAATSFASRRYVRWSSMCLAAMFALFVLLMDLPGAVAHPAARMGWILAARETTFALGALALFALATRDRAPQRAAMLVTVIRIWTAGVLVYYGIDHLLHPQLTPGVPSGAPTAAWVPFPHGIAYATGVLLIVFGMASLAERYASLAASLGGLLMLVLTVALYVPKFVRATTTADRVVGINYVFDTLLFAGTLFVIGRAIRFAGARAEAHSDVRAPVDDAGLASPAT